MKKIFFPLAHILMVIAIIALFWNLFLISNKGNVSEGGLFVLAFMAFAASLSYFIMSFLFVKSSKFTPYRIVIAFCIMLFVGNIPFLMLFVRNVQLGYQEESLGIVPSLISYEIVDGNLVKYKLKIDSAQDIENLQYTIYFSGNSESWYRDFGGHSLWENVENLVVNDTFRSNLKKGSTIIEGSYLIDKDEVFGCFQENSREDCLRNNRYFLTFDIAYGKYVQDTYSLANKRFVKAYDLQLDAAVVSEQVIAFMPLKQASKPIVSILGSYFQDNATGYSFAVKYFTNKKLTFQSIAGDKFDTAIASDGEVDIIYHIYPGNLQYENNYLCTDGSSKKIYTATATCFSRKYLALEQSNNATLVKYNEVFYVGSSKVEIYCQTKTKELVPRCDQLIQNSTFSIAEE